MSQRKRKYRFNIIDHLHYVAGWERLHNYYPKYREHITPLEDVLFFAVPVIALPFSVFFPLYTVCSHFRCRDMQWIPL